MNLTDIPSPDNSIEKLDELRESAVRKLEDALSERKLTQLETPVGTLRIYNGRTNAAPYSFLQWMRDEEIDARVTLEYSIGDGEDMNYVYGDFHHGWYNPTVDLIIHLLESWDDIIEAFKQHDERVARAAAIQID